MSSVDPERLRADFRSLYPELRGEVRLFAAPGRVNLIGEHTDYNDGFVLPMAIERRTVVAARARDDRMVRARSGSHGGEHVPVEIDLDRPGPPRRGGWIDYLEGVARALEGRGARLRGADFLVESDVPTGAGLSSSAALEVAVGQALLSISGLTMSKVDLALACQTAEHEYVGTKCGIMDQYVVSLGQADHALLIDCRSLEARPVPLDLSEARVLVCDSKVKHELAGSAYNTRRRECEQSVALLAEVLPGVRALRDVRSTSFAEHQARLPEPLRQRARHVITENERTLGAVVALGDGDLAKMGELMSASHRSLRDDYQVSAPELDVLVDAAGAVSGVFGSRMTGGGFGGCTVTLVRSSAIEALREALERALSDRFGRRPETFVTRAFAGVHEI
jgi:galactokinase